MFSGPADRLIVALDHPELGAALAQVAALGESVRRYKVGLELFTVAGPAAVQALTGAGAGVFLDLKVHDIPATAARACRAAAGLGAELVTVHAAGGRDMMAAAVKGAGPRTRVLAVTVLTSLERDDLAADGHPLSVEELVLRRARLAAEAGCAGVIASPREVAALRRALPPGFLIITPGVRPPGQTGGDDQRRVASAAEARGAGADAIVVGRPIRDAADPVAAARAFQAELA